MAGMAEQVALARVRAGESAAVSPSQVGRFEKRQQGNAMITLYHTPMTRSSRVLWLLEEVDAEYQIEPIEIRRRDGSGKPDPNNPHPLKQVPCIEIDGDIIVESLAVWLHLTDMHTAARMAPPIGAPERARYMGLMGLATAVFEPLVTAVMERRALTDRERQAQSSLDSILMRGLAKNPYLLSTEFSAADLVYASLLRFFPTNLPARTEYKTWLERISSRPAIARMREKDGVLRN